MFGTVLKNELKTIFRDKLYLFFMFYPAILGTVGYFLVPYIEENTAPGNPTASIVAMMLIIMTGFLFGALVAFTLLDDKDDKVLMSLKITPISVRHYVMVKLLVGMVFGLISTVVLIYATGFLPNTNFITIVLISILGAIQVPSVALIVNSFSNNKVEGFVIMKTSGLVLIFPVIGFLVTGWAQYLLGVAPGYWSARIVELELLPTESGSAAVVFIIGVAYNLLATWLLMKLYTKRSNI